MAFDPSKDAELVAFIKVFSSSTELTSTSKLHILAQRSFQPTLTLITVTRYAAACQWAAHFVIIYIWHIYM